eukprot:14985381-Ditylum_brightwellii.AAC.1
MQKFFLALSADMWKANSGGEGGACKVLESLSFQVAVCHLECVWLCVAVCRLDGVIVPVASC